MRKTRMFSRFGSIILPVLLVSLLSLPALGQEKPEAPVVGAEETAQVPGPVQTDQPQEPQQAQLPEETQTAEQPQVPDQPQAAEQPQVPEQPQATEQPQVPEQPQPQAPQYPQPQQPQFPQPQAPQYPQPQQPQFPQPQAPQYPQPQQPQFPQPQAPQYPQPQQPQYPQPQYINIDGVWGSMLNGQQVVMQVQGNQYQAWMNGAPYEGGVFQIQGNIMYGQVYGGMPFTRYIQMDQSGYYFTLSDPATGAYITYQRMR